MADTRLTPALKTVDYQKKFFRDYFRENIFSKYMGTNHNNVIYVTEGSKDINVPIAHSLTGRGVKGSATLRGGGERTKLASLTLKPEYFRNAIEINKSDIRSLTPDIEKEAVSLLLDWAIEKTRTDIILAMMDVTDIAEDTTTYADGGGPIRLGSASSSSLDTTNQDRWYAANRKRISMAGTIGTSTTTIAYSAANASMTVDKLLATKKIAQNAEPAIHPIRVKDGSEYFVFFCGSTVFYELAKDDDMKEANYYTNIRGMDNPLLTGDALQLHGILIKHIPEMDRVQAKTFNSNSSFDIAAAAAGSSNRIYHSAFCGKGALGMGLGQRPKIHKDMDYDYNFEGGIAVECLHDIKKSIFNSIQHGMVSVFSTS